MVHRAGALDARRYLRPRDRARAPSRLYARESEPAARARRQFCRGESGALPRGGRAPVCLPGRPRARARPAQSASGRATRGELRAVAALRGRTEDQDARAAGADRGIETDLEGPVRDRDACARAADGRVMRWMSIPAIALGALADARASTQISRRIRCA